jgi:hypothetical protein
MHYAQNLIVNLLTLPVVLLLSSCGHNAAPSEGDEVRFQARPTGPKFAVDQPQAATIKDIVKRLKQAKPEVLQAALLQPMAVFTVKEVDYGWTEDSLGTWDARRQTWLCLRDARLRPAWDAFKGRTPPAANEWTFSEQEWRAIITKIRSNEQH